MNVSYWHVIKAMLMTWHGWVALFALVALIGGAVAAFFSGNIVLGVLLAIFAILYFLALAVFASWTLVLSTIVLMFLRAFFGGFFGF